MKRIKQYWIKERCNPQLGTYWVGYGQLSKGQAKNLESPLYGCNIMHSYETEEAYQARLRELREKGEHVQ